MLNFDFLEKGLGIISPPHFMYDFSRKMFLMLNSINWPNFIVWLPLVLEILRNMHIICLVNCDIMSFEINLLSANFTKWSNTLKQFVGNLPFSGIGVWRVNFIFLIMLFFYMTKKPKQKYKCLENKKSF